MRAISFIDAKGSTKDACLLGPPSVEFAPFGRIPNGRPRKDARQGTIDQDPEFMEFLESLTNPVTKASLVDQDADTIKSKEKVTVTPLIQYLRDKKVNKGKETVAAKSAKQGRQEKDHKAVESTATVQMASSPKKKTAQATKVEQAAREAVKVLNKQAGNAKAASPAPAAPKAQTVTPNVAPNSAATALAGKQRERGNVSAAAKILQRDLGIGGSPRGRGGKRGVADSPGRNASYSNQPGGKPAVETTAQQQTAQTAKLDPPKAPEAASPATEAGQAASTRPPTGPAAERTTPKPASNPPVQPAATKPTPPTSTSTQAFLKHANPSQGVTEPLLEEAFKTFGPITKVEIDKKKGFAYVEFVEPESLRKAITASPIKIAQASVQVLERKTASAVQARNIARNNGPVMNNKSVRGGAPMMGNANARGGPMMGNHNPRGGPPPINSRGMPLGGRGGHVGRRGGMGRGGANSAHGNQTKAGLAAPAAASKDASPSAATQSQPTPSPGPGRAAPVEPAGS